MILLISFYGFLGFWRPSEKVADAVEVILKLLEAFPFRVLEGLRFENVGAVGQRVLLLLQGVDAHSDDLAEGVLDAFPCFGALFIV